MSAVFIRFFHFAVQTVVKRARGIFSFLGNRPTSICIKPIVQVFQLEVVLLEE